MQEVRFAAGEELQCSGSAEDSAILLVVTGRIDTVLLTAAAPQLPGATSAGADSNGGDDFSFDGEAVGAHEPIYIAGKAASLWCSAGIRKSEARAFWVEEPVCRPLVEMPGRFAPQTIIIGVATSGPAQTSSRHASDKKSCRPALPTQAPCHWAPSPTCWAAGRDHKPLLSPSVQEISRMPFLLTQAPCRWDPSLTCWAAGRDHKPLFLPSIRGAFTNAVSAHAGAMSLGSITDMLGGMPRPTDLGAGHILLQSRGPGELFFGALRLTLHSQYIHGPCHITLKIFPPPTLLLPVPPPSVVRLFVIQCMPLDRSACVARDVSASRVPQLPSRQRCLVYRRLAH